LIDKLGSARYVTTLDLSRGYWQVPVAEESRPLTAFVTPYGLYQFRVMPVGLNGAPATFQRLMDEVLRGLEGFHHSSKLKGWVSIALWGSWGFNTLSNWGIALAWMTWETCSFFMGICVHGGGDKGGRNRINNHKRLLLA